MKKKLNIMLMLVIAIVLCACGKSKEGTTSLANPMVEINSADEFSSKLGINLEVSAYPEDAKMYIISDSIAHVTYSIEGMDGEAVNVILRAAKSDEDISGVYDDNMTSNEMNYDNLTIVNRSSVANNTEIYDFQNNGITYCVIVEGEVSQMTIGEILDSTMLVCGIDM